MVSKRASSAFETLGTIVIVCATIFIILWALTGGFKNFTFGLYNCEGKGYQCLASCGNLEAKTAFDRGCHDKYKNQNLVCCEPEQTATGQQARGAGANSNRVQLLVDKGTALYYGERRDIEIRDTAYKIDPVLDYKQLRETGHFNDLTYMRCSIFLTDAETQQVYVLKRDSTGSCTGDPNGNYSLIEAKYAFNSGVQGDNSNIENFVVTCNGDRVEGAYDQLIPRCFKPTDLQAGRTYKVSVIVYDNDTSEALKGFQGEFDSPTTDQQVKIKSMIFDPQHWLAEFTSYLRVKPIIEISDISNSWAAYDDITVTANAPYKLSKVYVGIIPGDNEAINAEAGTSIYTRINQACQDLASANYHSELASIKNTKTGTIGFSLAIFSLGREAYQRAQYEASQPQIIKIDNGQKATVHIDASTIATTFNIRSMLTEDLAALRSGSSTLKEQYLCVKADVYDANGKTRTIRVASTQPLRIDVAPPYIENTDQYIEIVYPDYSLFQQEYSNLIAQNRISPGQTLTPYYFERYPRVVINHCYDKSGCKNYDYYFAPTYLQINVNTNDLGSGILATVLGAGINYLYNYLATRNPLETLCPIPDSYQYRSNSRPEIRFGRSQSQGVFCLRVADAAGNYWLTWKAVYEPFDVLEEVIAGGTTGTAGTV